MTPLAWLEEDLEVDRGDLLRALVVSPFLLAGLGVLMAFIYAMSPA